MIFMQILGLFALAFFPILAGMAAIEWADTKAERYQGRHVNYGGRHYAKAIGQRMAAI